MPTAMLAHAAITLNGCYATYGANASIPPSAELQVRYHSQPAWRKLTFRFASSSMTSSAMKTTPARS